MVSKKKVALVTGATSGIGAAVAVRLAADGFDLALNCHSEASKQGPGLQVLSECEQFGARVKFYVCDVSSFEDCSKMVDQVCYDFGRIDCLVNNAGMTCDGFLIRMTEADFDRVTNVNYKSVFNLCRLVGAKMVAQKGGRIVNMSSVVGLCGNACQFNYAASKAGIIGMTKSAAKELGRRNVLVNAVAPGFVETKMTDDLPQDFKSKILEQISLKRFAKPGEVAGVVSFLCGPDSSYVNGQVLVVDGSLAM